MKELQRSPEEAKTRLLYKIVLFVSVTAVLLITIYAIYVSLVFGVNVIGEPLVYVRGKPFELPTPEIFPIYAKPVSWLYIAMLAGWFSFLELAKERALRTSTFKISLFKIVAFLTALISAYEILYNFSIWSALMSYQATIGDIRPDALINKDPNPLYPWNLVFATKMFTAFTAISAYTLYYLHKLEHIKELSSQGVS